ncbi:aminotransferase class-III family protein [Lyngbya aestuarii BL J]|uniref:Aminotransferase class-III family protein n=1 Tax=Lyngbya aestuarii BL J TaxID=1348334 RepID=U7QFR1_9CYAN|nr:aspartate aminotransferase family protein [Lyngbya aestuarii]ERT06748.1 aminotransferase class-III family protein [Lyngbya aestuarii BL J]
MQLQTKDTNNLEQSHIETLIQDYIQRTPKSKKYAQDSRSVLADKSSLGLSFEPQLKEACYSIVAERSLGSRLWDIDGNEYLDILMGLGINLFGHNPPFIKAAIQEQLEKGIQIGSQAELAGEVAQLVSELTGMERVTFSNTGTEAIMTAIRIARTATKRKKIVVFTNSYHGHHDQTLVRAKLTEYAKKAVRRKIDQKSQSNRFLQAITRPIEFGLKSTIDPQAVPAALGIPGSLAKDVLVLEYGNPYSLNVIKSNSKNIAAVLVEPVQSRCPELQPKDFIQQLRTLTQERGIALIFDEMVTGFRIHPGGAQAWFGVQADIATYSKIVGGGLPMSILAGKAKYLDKIDGGMWNFGDNSAPQEKTTFFAGTFCKHPLSLAAAKAALLHLKTQGSTLQEQLNQRTLKLVNRLNTAIKSENIPVHFTHFGSFFAIAMSESSISPLAINLLSYHLLTKGIHLRRGDKGGFLSTAHTDEDINTIFQTFKQGLVELKEAGIISGY